MNEICIFSENIPPSFDGYRIVQISDLHLDSYAGRSKSLSEAVSKINGLDPDMKGYDWCSLKVVLEDYGEEWYLVALVHSEWTI